MFGYLMERVVEVTFHGCLKLIDSKA